MEIILDGTAPEQGIMIGFCENSDELADFP
jgi:hypothetical protein